MDPKTRPFKCSVLGREITGQVTKSSNSLEDFYVTAYLGDEAYSFDFIMVRSPPLHVCKVLHSKTRAEKLTLSKCEPMPANLLFERVLTEMVLWDPQLRK